MDSFDDNLRALYSRAQKAAAEEPSCSGRYTQQTFIAKGSIKEVYSVMDNTTGRRVALALLQEGLDAQSARLFKRQARINALLQHPNILPVYDAGTNEQGRPFMIMKLVEGRDLKQLINDSAITFDALIEVFDKICEALAYAHSRKILQLNFHRRILLRQLLRFSFFMLLLSL